MSVGGDFSKIFHAIWKDPAFVGLDPRPQRLFLMLLSHPSRNFAGVLPLTLARWSRTARGLTPTAIREDLDILGEARFTVTDYSTEEVLVRTYLRWDGLYRQPQYHRTLAEDILSPESDRLRTALYSELSRLLGTDLGRSAKSVEPWLQETAKALVPTPSDPFREGFPEPLPEGLPGTVSEGVGEPLPEGSVVCTYLSSSETTDNRQQTTGNSAEAHPHSRPPRSPMNLTEIVTGHPETPPEPPPPDLALVPAVSNGHSRTAAQLVRSVLPKEQLQIGAVRTELTNQACALLVKGVSEADVAAGLQDWCSKELHPKVLPSLVSDAIKRRSGTTKRGGADAKAIEWQDLKTRGGSA